MSALVPDKTTPIVDVLTESPLWEKEPRAADTVERAIAAAAQAIDAPLGEFVVMLADDETIRGLNRDWRKIDKPTNVLSFPAASTPGIEPAMLGDIVIAYE